jgi:hypothetical protein
MQEIIGCPVGSPASKYAIRARSVCTDLFTSVLASSAAAGATDNENATPAAALNKRGHEP